MNFYDLPTIPKQNIYREARVSETRGDRVFNRLADEGLISPTTTPTQRTLLSPKDGERVFDDLVGKNK